MHRKIFILIAILYITCIPCRIFAYNVAESSFLSLDCNYIEQYYEDDNLNQLLDKCKSIYTTESYQYAECILWCAYLCVEKGDNKQGKRLFNKSKSLFRRYGKGTFNGRDTLTHIFSLDLNAKIERVSGRDYFAIRLFKKSCELKKEYFGEDSEPYLNALLDLSQLYAERLKLKKSNIYHNLGYEAYVERIKNEFCATTESQRSMYWEVASKYINRTLDLAHQIGKSSSNGGNHSLASAAYNAMLLSKGLLLNTTLGFEEFIYKSNNEKAISILHTKKAWADQQVPLHVLDSLDYEIINALQQKGQQFQLPHLSIKWKDVASKLSKNDLAIEFYKTKDGDYGAILLKNDWVSPKIVQLDDYVEIDGKFVLIEDALKNFSLEHYTKENHVSLWNLSKTIWSDDIIRHFPQGDDGCIYFSADGELLITGIEYLPFVCPDDDGTLYGISDLFNMYRLSSTRELVYEKGMNNNNQAAIYGGLNYDMQYKELISDDKQYSKKVYSPKDKVQTRAADGIIYLPGTKIEADSILTIIDNADFIKLQVKAYIGNTGTETSFKSLGNSNQRLIHVASHGYFYSEDDADFELLELGDHPMNRSGLLFAGADNKWFGEMIPKGIDDGFLTALEISNIDFRNLELIVLSACETGKGSIKNDGVFGLQRGFKMAGANSILMSLWKVDDAATCELMTEFYRNWMNGKTKHDALELAKESVRSQKEKGWDDPKYWAAFILLDGLD